MSLLRFLSLSLVVLGLIAPGTVKAEQTKPIQVDTTEATAVGMIALGSWGTASMVWGGVSLSQAEPDTWDEGFARMNLVWGAVNASIAGSTGLFLAIQSRSSTTPEEKARFAAMKRTSLAVNLGLDCGYLATGLLLEQLGMARGNQRLEGMGPAIALQGAVLIGLDAVLLTIHLLHERHHKSPSPVALGPNGLTLRF
jgi:hypothetical protein